MKLTLTTLFGGLLVSLFFINNKVGEPIETAEYNLPDTLTSQQVIESTDLYKRVVKIEDTIELIKEYQHEQDIERLTQVTNR